MQVGRLLVVAGLVITGLGLLAMVAGRMNWPLGRLPGDLVWRGRQTTIYFPWVTSLLLSVLGTLLLWLVNKRG